MKYVFLLAIACFSKLALASDVTATVTNASPGTPTGAITLTVTVGIAPYTYSWVGPGAFTATTKNISGLYSGTYSVTVTDAYCGVAKLTVLVDSVATNIHEEGIEALSLSVYPNPATTDIALKLNHSVENAFINIYDVSGNRVMQEAGVTGDKFSIHLSELLSGIYFIEIGNTIETRRVLFVKND